MRCLCERCFKYKFWFEMIEWATCRKCVEELHAKIDLKIRKAFGK